MFKTDKISVSKGVTNMITHLVACRVVDSMDAEEFLDLWDNPLSRGEIYSHALDIACEIAKALNLEVSSAYYGKMMDELDFIVECLGGEGDFNGF